MRAIAQATGGETATAGTRGSSRPSTAASEAASAASRDARHHLVVRARRRPAARRRGRARAAWSARSLAQRFRLESRSSSRVAAELGPAGGGAVVEPSRIVGSAPSSSSASTASRRPAWAARWSAVTPSPWSGPPNVPRRFGSAPSSTSSRTESTRPFTAAQVERRAAVGVGVDPRAELDEQRQRLDPVALRRPDERLVEHLLRVVRRLPGGEAAVGPVEARCAPAAGSRRARRISSGRPRPAATRRFPGSSPSSGDDLAVAPEERRDQRRAAVAARREVEAAAGVEHHLRRARAGSSSRPGGASSSRSRCRGSDRRRARAAARRSRGSFAIPSRSLPFVPRGPTSSGCASRSATSRPRSSSSTAR